MGLVIRIVYNVLHIQQSYFRVNLRGNRELINYKLIAP
jgi:hypothetical protein